VDEILSSRKRVCAVFGSYRVTRKHKKLMNDPITAKNASSFSVYHKVNFTVDKSTLNAFTTLLGTKTNGLQTYE
jgi:hypothetical protein